LYAKGKVEGTVVFFSDKKGSR